MRRRRLGSESFHSLVTIAPNDVIIDEGARVIVAPAIVAYFLGGICRTRARLPVRARASRRRRAIGDFISSIILRRADSPSPRNVTRSNHTVYPYDASGVTTTNNAFEP